MSLGGRKCPTIKANSFRSPNIRPTPGDPPLFLYPRSFPSTYKSQALPTISTVRRTSPRSNPHPECQHGHDAFSSRNSIRVHVRNSAQGRCTKVWEKLEHGRSSPRDTLHPETTERKLTWGIQAAHGGSSNCKGLNHVDGVTDVDWEKATIEAFLAQKNPKYTTNPAARPVRSLDEVGPWAEDKFRRVVSSPGRTVASQDTVPFLQRATRREEIRLDNRLANQILKDKGALSSDWRVPLKLLLANKSAFLERKIDDTSVSIFIPEAVQAKLLGSLHEGTWTIYLKSKCQIRVLPRSESRGVMRQCLLKGSPLSIDLTKDYISSVWADVAESRPGFVENVPFIPQASFLKPLSDDHDPIIRAVWAEDRGKLTPRRVDHIPRPVEWSVKSFADYIEDLTADYMPKGMHRYFYAGNERHIVMVETIIKNLFGDPANIIYFSSRALNVALRFLFEFRLLKTLRYLCIRFDETHGTFVTETFNIMLHGAATENDLFSYTYALALMIRQGIRADARAWVCLLYTINSQEVRLVILQHMKRAGFLDDPNVVKQAIGAIVKETFASHIDSDKDFNSYLEWMDWRYGHSWFGRVAANKILSALADRGRLDGVSDVMKTIYEREVRVDTATLNITLILCRHLRSIAFAIDSLKEICVHFPVSADKMTYWILFDMAWNGQLHNVCRVVWAHACLNGLASHNMRVLILRSLWKQTEDSPESIWHYQAGKVISGTFKSFSSWKLRNRLTSSEPDTDGTRASLNMNQSGAANSVTVDLEQPILTSPLSKSSPPPNSSKYRVRLARTILYKDLKAALHWQPCLPMHQDLCRAYAQDLEWERSGAAEAPEANRLKWMIEHGYQVPLKKRLWKTHVPPVQQERLDLAEEGKEEDEVGNEGDHPSAWKPIAALNS